MVRPAFASASGTATSFECSRLRMAEDALTKRPIAPIARPPPAHRPEINSRAETLRDVIANDLRIGTVVNAQSWHLTRLQPPSQGLRHPASLRGTSSRAKPGIVVGAHRRGLPIKLESISQRSLAGNETRDCHGERICVVVCCLSQGTWSVAPSSRSTPERRLCNLGSHGGHGGVAFAHVSGYTWPL